MGGKNNSIVLLSCVSFLILQFLCLCFGTQLNIFSHLLAGDCGGLCVSLLLNCVKLVPVGSTVRYEMLKLCSGSVEDTMRR